MFRRTCGVAPEAAASGPGRVNLLGEHTDYNGGPVLPMAIAARTVVAVGRGEPGVLELISALDGRVARIDYRAGRAGGWGAYAAGVMHELVAAGGAPPGARAPAAGAAGPPAGGGAAPAAAA